MMNFKKAKGQQTMAKTDNKNGQAKNDEFSRIFDEYRAKIDEITRRTDKNLQQAEVTDDNNNRTNGEPAAVSVPDEQIALNNGSKQEVAELPDKAAEEIIEKARHEAQRIIDEAEEGIKKEAKKKTQSKVDKIIEKARKDSEDLIVGAKQAAEREREEITAASKREAEVLIKNITDEYRAETKAHSDQVIAQARETAEEILADIVASSTEISQHIVNVVNRARETINELEKSLQSEMDELNSIIAKTQARMEQVAVANIKKHEEEPVINEKKERKPTPDSDDEQLPNETDLFVKFVGDKTNGDNGKSPLFSGQMELKAISSFEYKQIRSIKNHLVSIPNIKYMQEYASEKEMSVLFEIKEPLPLLDIFNNFPQVDKVATVDNGITLTLKNHS
jgi:cell division septum initiation protein DivIVA